MTSECTLGLNSDVHSIGNRISTYKVLIGAYNFDQLDKIRIELSMYPGFTDERKEPI